VERGRPSRGTTTMIRNKWVLLASRLAVGGLFIWAGVLKIIDPLGFAQSIKNYRLFPHELAFIIAIILPWVEALSGVFLITRVFRRSSALLLSLMLVGFIGLVALALWRGIDTTCGCFGSLSRKADLKLILLDTVLLYLALNIFAVKQQRH
jgi:putative oxidoreductase